MEDNSRMSLRIRPEDKALLMRAAAYEHTDLTSFVLRNAIEAAKAVIVRAERVALSERDSLRVLEALENPPRPKAKLPDAVNALPWKFMTMPLLLFDAKNDGIARRYAGYGALPLLDSPLSLLLPMATIRPALEAAGRL